MESHLIWLSASTELAQRLGARQERDCARLGGNGGSGEGRLPERPVSDLQGAVSPVAFRAPPTLLKGIISGLG